jgi:hypothetical protein
MRRSRARFTVRAMMGVTAIVAMLMPGVVCVLRAEQLNRWPLAILIAYFYVILSPAILAVTFPCFWPQK